MDNRIVAPTLAQLYCQAAKRYGELPAFATRKGPLNWLPVSFRELYEQGLDLATGLIHLGVQPGDHIGLFSDNRVEWILADYGIQLSGAVNVPRGSDVTEEELVYIINHSGMKIAFVEDREFLDRVMLQKERLPNLESVILMDDGESHFTGVERLGNVRKAGAGHRSDGDESAVRRMAETDPEDLFTLIYTSGTTGTPKGVMLTNSNMMSQMEMIPIDLSCTDRVLSILPVWHIFERVFEVYTISCGACTYYSGVRTLAEDLQQVEPTFMGSAPRLWESLHQRILNGVRQAHPVRRFLFRTGYGLAHYYKASLAFMRGNDLRLEPVSRWIRAIIYPIHMLRWLLLLPWYGFFNAAVLEPVRQRTGGALKATVSGGGALPGEIDQFFNDLGIPVLEGYGLTETSPVIAVRTPEKLVVGTVGPLMPKTDIRIVDLESGAILFPSDKSGGGRGKKGEIEVRGPQVMKGYYRQPELTSETIRDGWLKTGDLGMMTYNDCLKIMGRRKATVVLSSGENLEPEPIEMRLKQSPFLENCMVVGQDQKHIGLLALPSLEGFQKAGMSVETLEELIQNPETKKRIRQEVRSRISRQRGFKRHELIREIRLIPEPFTVGDEMTGLYKLKRHRIEEKYASLIREMYEREDSRTAV